MDNRANEVEERRRLMVELFDAASIKRAMGMELHYDRDGCAVFDMPYNSRFDHFLGGIHGGIISTLLDNAGWFTAAAYYDTWISTLDLNVKLLEWAEKEDLRSRGWMVRRGKRVAVADMEVRTSEGRLVATGSGIFVVTGKALKNKTA